MLLIFTLEGDVILFRACRYFVRFCLITIIDSLGSVGGKYILEYTHDWAFKPNEKWACH